jgi:type VI secretion system secreted protein VgrG
VRVASTSAGKNWGFVTIPRIGQEVIVDFLEGDPDRPLIVGRVYNAEQMPPYTLPGNQTQSGFKSRSSKGGGTENFNELRFEDKKGSEQIFLHAEKDMVVEVENDRNTTIGNNETKEVTKGNETITIKKGNQSLTIEMGNQSVTLNQGNQSIVLKMGDQSTELDMGNVSTTLKMGNMTTKLNLGKSETEAMQSIELKVGQSSVKVDQMGVHIKGMMIDIQAQVQAQLKAIMTQVQGEAMLIEKGGLTMIN